MFLYSTYCFVANVETSWNKLLERLTSWLDLTISNFPNLLLALLIFAVAYSLAKSSQKWSNIFLQNLVTQKAVRNLFARVLSIVIIALGIFIALGVLNLDRLITSLLAGAGVVGLVIGLALQGPLANTFSGIFLAFEDEINVGDFIETNSYSGTILKIDLRNTTIKEPDNNLVVIPNKMVLENAFKNYGLTDRTRVAVKCGVAYSSDLEEVKTIAIETIEAIFPKADNKTISFYYTEFTNSSINFQLYFWLDTKAEISTIEAKSKTIMGIKVAFENHNIEIRLPIVKLAN